MLKGIDPILSPELLEVLAAMGHGDTLAIVDANFPADTNAQRLVRLVGVGAPRALEAVLSLVPLDDFVESPLAVMEVVGDPDMIPELVREFQRVANRAEGKEVSTTWLKREEFYERSRKAFAIVATGETGLYGDVLLTKGVIRPETPADRS